MKMAANKFEMVATKIRYNIFYLRHLKIQVENCSFYLFTGWNYIFLMFVNCNIET